MSIELKTCPFCGGRAAMKAVNKKYGFTIWCQCRKCGARTEGYCPDMNHEDDTITSIEECKDRAAKVSQRYGITGRKVQMKLRKVGKPLDGKT